MKGIRSGITDLEADRPRLIGGHPILTVKVLHIITSVGVRGRVAPLYILPKEVGFWYMVMVLVMVMVMVLVTLDCHGDSRWIVRWTVTVTVRWVYHHTFCLYQDRTVHKHQKQQEASQSKYADCICTLFARQCRGDEKSDGR